MYRAPRSDLVCFRVAAFTAILAFGCCKFDFKYNRNLISKAGCEVLFLTKMNYASTCWHTASISMVLCAQLTLLSSHIDHTLLNES